jgi:NTE family protein
MRVHLIRSALLTELGASSKLNAEWDFLTMLRDEGRRAAELFMAENGPALGKRSTLPIEHLLNTD